MGVAKCAEEDLEFMNDRTGENIALMRAEIKYYRYIRDNELIPAYNALKELHYSFNGNKNYNKDSLEARRIRKHMYMYEADIETVRELIRLAQTDLKMYIMTKDGLYHDLKIHKAEADN